ncbi:hypothetical protein MAPG_05750 [Magnaporthiopsis poae ATCC 64411]|uniref:Uncharacterized protein n=1 Tax=Magnaporthiopsis poae (strain ATCC 64411 / 73-15) TaxID=644358 RepID=A0A0C4E083_MAGP6|nr:hypothetical protein MAPG_05750 [Magnaporthiopsis poae ATCC 64411]
MPGECNRRCSGYVATSSCPALPIRSAGSCPLMCVFLVLALALPPHSRETLGLARLRVEPGLVCSCFDLGPPDLGNEHYRMRGDLGRLGTPTAFAPVHGRGQQALGALAKHHASRNRGTKRPGNQFLVSANLAPIRRARRRRLAVSNRVMTPPPMTLVVTPRKQAAARRDRGARARVAPSRPSRSGSGRATRCPT